MSTVWSQVTEKNCRTVGPRSLLTPLLPNERGWTSIRVGDRLLTRCCNEEIWQVAVAGGTLTSLLLKAKSFTGTFSVTFCACLDRAAFDLVWSSMLWCDLFSAVRPKKTVTFCVISIMNKIDRRHLEVLDTMWGNVRSQLRPCVCVSCLELLSCFLPSFILRILNLCILPYWYTYIYIQKPLVSPSGL